MWEEPSRTALRESILVCRLARQSETVQPDQDTLSLFLPGPGSRQLRAGTPEQFFPVPRLPFPSSPHGGISWVLPSILPLCLLPTLMFSQKALRGKCCLGPQTYDNPVSLSLFSSHPKLTITSKNTDICVAAGNFFLPCPQVLLLPLLPGTSLCELGEAAE